MFLWFARGMNERNWFSAQALFIYIGKIIRISEFIMLSLEHITIQFGERSLFQDVTATIGPRDRIGSGWFKRQR